MVEASESVGTVGTVVVLGSGTAVPVPDRFPAGYAVAAGRDLVMVDCGPGALRRLAQAGFGLDRLGAVLLTHFHTDHCADVAALLFALRDPRYAGRPPLRLIAAAGLGEWLAHLTAAWPWLSPRGYELSVEEIAAGDRAAFADLAVEAFPIRHTAQSLAYRFSPRAGGWSAAFSGDADECDGLVAAAAGVDLFVCDAAFPDGHKVDGHLTPGLAARAAQRAGAKVLCATHFYPQCEWHDLRAAAQAEFAGRVVLAEDLMRFELGGS